MSVLQDDIHILLADDDNDDCLLFREVMVELQTQAHLYFVNNGELLMLRLNDKEKLLPQVLFLDINLPRKNGLDCLREIKQNPFLLAIPIIIFSTTADTEMMKLLHEEKADYFIRKPGPFEEWKEVIAHALVLVAEGKRPTQHHENFMLNPKSAFHGG